MCSILLIPRCLIGTGMRVFLTLACVGGSHFRSWPKGCEFDPGSRQLLGERYRSLVNPSRTIWPIVT